MERDTVLLSMIVHGLQDIRVMLLDGIADVVEVVARLVPDVQVKLGSAGVGKDLTNRGKRFVDAVRVLRNQRHPDDRLKIRTLDASEPPIRVDGAIPAAGQP